MDKIVEKVKTLIGENIAAFLPQVKLSDLEDNGAVFCMNGRNGIEFDWYVNEKISDFMVFYDDDEKLGAVKLTVYDDGDALMFLYDDHGKTIAKEIQTKIDVPEQEILEFAVALKKLEDEKSLFDPDIDAIARLPGISSEDKEKFLGHRRLFGRMIERKKIVGQFAYVSKKVAEEGWNVGYMKRSEPLNEQDSGWMFMAGDEDDEYTNDTDNIKLLTVGYVWQNLDKAIWKNIVEPVGSGFVRISADEFEKDDGTQDIFVHKG